MNIAQILLDDASAYERKSQRVDFQALSAENDVHLLSLQEAARSGADVAHVYAGASLPSSELAGFPLPYLANVDVSPSRWSLRRPSIPSAVVSPLIATVTTPRHQPLPEAVEEEWFRWREETGGWRREERATWTVASFARPDTLNLIQQTLARIGRVREDISWVVFDRPPVPADLRGVDLWADPAVEAADLDGFVAEALVGGVPVVAARTSINEIRLEQGRTGTLVRPRDPNEWAHAILSALFKPEATGPKLQAATQTLSKFRCRTRLRLLGRIYQTLIS